MKAPKSTTGYIVVCPDWDPSTEPSTLWNQRPKQDAEAAAERMRTHGCSRTVVVEVRTTFRIVGPAEAVTS